VPKTEWWSDFFSGLALDLWRQAMSKEHTAAEVAFIGSRLRLAPGSRILDVPCGLGRLSLEIAALGFEVTGVDFSPACLDEARAAAVSRHLNVIWEQRDMRDLPWREQFDGVFCFGNSFGYLDDEGNSNFLKSVYRVLKQGARFVLDAPSVAENILPRIQDRSETQIGDVLFIEENRYDHVLGRLDTDYTFKRGDLIEKKFGSHRLYTYRQIHELLHEAGFVKCEAFGSPAGEPFRYGSQGLLFVAEKER
jgi:SAM-dependent methyltransferase